jgi:hypothetical protein
MTYDLLQLSRINLSYVSCASVVCCNTAQYNLFNITEFFKVKSILCHIEGLLGYDAILESGGNMLSVSCLFGL